MASDASTQWWRDSAAHFGFTVMDKTVKNQEDWDRLLASGRKDFQRALALTGSADGTAQLWSVPDGVGLGGAFSHGRPVYAVAFASNGGSDSLRNFV